MRVDGSVVVVTGGTGLLGQSVSRVLRSAGAQVLSVGRNDFDLRQRQQVRDMLRTIRPDVVVHLAGTRRDADTQAVRSHYDNVIMGVELIEACRLQPVKKVLMGERASEFPSISVGPMRREDPGYAASTDIDVDAMAHRMLRAQTAVYRQGVRLDVSLLALSNVYEARPGYSPELASIVRTMLAAFRGAVEQNSGDIHLWSSGPVSTPFLHLSDAARSVLAALEGDPQEAGGVGRGVALQDVAAIVADHAGYRGAITWSASEGINADGAVGRIPSEARAGGMRRFVEWCERTDATTSLRSAPLCA